MTPVLEARDITRDYHVPGSLFKKSRTVHAVKGVSFSVGEGKTLAIVGESGCGKSTLARIVTMIDPATSGDLLIDGRRIDIATEPLTADMRSKVQIVFQNPYGSLNPRRKIGEILTEPLIINAKMRADEREARAMAMLKKVGLEEKHYGRYPHMFSGGQRQRVAIARALAARPDFIVCDEPTSALDVSVQAQILNLMKDLQDEFGLTFLFISHDLSVVRHMANRIGVLYLGRLAEVADSKTLFAKPRHPYTRMLLDAVPDLEMTGRKRKKVEGEIPNPINPPPGCAFHPRCPFANERCRMEIPQLLWNGEGETACHGVEEGRI